MVGPGAWPETDESVFTDRATQLNEKLSALTAALDGWGSHQASIFNGPHVWSGVGASAAGGKVEANAQAMRDHEQQLRDAIGWCNEAAGHIGTAKQSITDNVNAGIDEINQTLDAASQSDKDPTAAIDAIVQRKYDENVSTLGNAAKLLDFKGDLPAAPPHEADPNNPGATGPAKGNQFDAVHADRRRGTKNSDLAQHPRHLVARLDPVKADGPGRGIRLQLQAASSSSGSGCRLQHQVLRWRLQLEPILGGGACPCPHQPRSHPTVPVGRSPVVPATASSVVTRRFRWLTGRPRH